MKVTSATRPCRKRQNQAGFSLVEIMIGGAILGGVMLGMTSMMNFSNRAVMSTKVTSDFNSLVTILQGVLNDSTNCKTVLGTFTLDPAGAFPQAASPLKSNGTTGSVLAQTGPMGSTLNITNLEFRSATPLASTHQYMATLHLTANKVVGGGSVGGQTLNHDFNVSVTIDPALGNKIVGCSGQGDTLWQKAANGADIYYNNGNVGVGTVTPAEKLDVSGNAKVSGVLSSGKVQVVDVVAAGGGCSPNGLVARDGSGSILSCSSGTWKAPTTCIPCASSGTSANGGCGGWMIDITCQGGCLKSITAISNPGCG